MNHPKFVDARAKSGNVRRNQSKYYPGAVFVLEGKLDRTFVVEYATANSHEIKCYGIKNFCSKNMITLIGFKPVKTIQQLDELKVLLSENDISIPGMDRARARPWD